jgi:dephospho-CoA kinase
MRIFALTGGIATGKSTVCELIREIIPGVEIFDCDACVKSLFAGDEAVGTAVVEKFGPEARLADGTINRGFLRETIYADAAKREVLEGILHPRVREECLASRDAAAKQGRVVFVADVPLLFEKGFDFGQERSLLIATTRTTQIQRLKARNGFDDALVEAMLASQLPLSEKLLRANTVFWNEGPLEILRAQVHRFYLSLS